MLKVSTAGDGLLAKCRVIPAGNDKTISPIIFTTHLGKERTGSEKCDLNPMYTTEYTLISCESGAKYDPRMEENISSYSVTYLLGSAPLKKALTVSVKAAATGSVSWAPMVRGLGPLEQPGGNTHTWTYKHALNRTERDKMHTQPVPTTHNQRDLNVPIHLVFLVKINE